MRAFTIMLLPPKVGNLLNRALPRSLIRGLHWLYDPYHHWAVQRFSRRLIDGLFPGGTLLVLGGPFEGMKYLPQSSGSALVPKLLGSYEMELHQTFYRSISTNYRRIVDIGCAEGYYTVGAALRIPHAAVYGFDIVPASLQACRRLAELNGVTSRVHLSGQATIGNLTPLVGRGTLVISDCEGAEVELLDPGKIPDLIYADMIVELHDRLIPNASETMRNRFTRTHDMLIVQSTDRNPADFPLLRGLSSKDQFRAVDEFRGGQMQWAVMRSRFEQL